ncbi:RagB/SusD family nutrient uptake outer membrane protein [Alistipes sp. kh20]|uniref:RagB/SusD family nutrient uptake outer membrane protein n=1 Tax=Alistipes montrealensis TaxID=2834113 RepID=UPI001BCB060F|nr:RagB/SusD family nutrient uptake outer membrane protein [Alistipes montrealensis]MBS4766916.1 RagB/SusD family nutrient uptake outer membrane protein [Alistipes montrealensis]
MKRLIILALALTTGLTACEDWLDKKPLDKISQYDYFKDATALELFSNPFYNNLLAKEPFKEQSDQLVQYNLSNEMIGGNKRTVPSTGGGWTWTDLRRMNTLLAMAAEYCEDPAAVTKYSAITRFFRAFFYFDKVKRFGDVPWYDKELGSADPELYKARDSRELVLTNMIKDIDDAVNSGGLSEKATPYRVNKWTALALKARFCLYEGTYRKYHGINLEGHDYKYYLDLAAETAKQIMDESPYKLFKTGNPATDYVTLFTKEDADEGEYMLAIKNDAGLQIFHNATGYAVMVTQGRPGLTRKLVNAYLMKDGKKFTDQPGWQEMTFLEETKNRDPRMAQSVRTPGYTRIGSTTVEAPDISVANTGYQLVKFVQARPPEGDRGDKSTCDMPVFRFTEVLLNYAEAKAEAGTLTQEDLRISINLIRSRAGMPDLDMVEANKNPDWYLSSEEYGYPNVTGPNKGVILEIRRERAIELLEEGFRYNDLMRWKAGYCIDQPITGIYFPGPGEYDLSGDGKADVILYPKGSAKPSAGEGVQVYELDKDIYLTEEKSSKGYMFYHKTVERTKFNEGRDYLYPIPSTERELNPNLEQNPGWSDGLSH